MSPTSCLPGRHKAKHTLPLYLPLPLPLTLSRPLPSPFFPLLLLFLSLCFPSLPVFYPSHSPTTWPSPLPLRISFSLPPSPHPSPSPWTPPTPSLSPSPLSTSLSPSSLTTVSAAVFSFGSFVDVDCDEARYLLNKNHQATGAFLVRRSPACEPTNVTTCVLTIINNTFVTTNLCFETVNPLSLRRRNWQHVATVLTALTGISFVCISVMFANEATNGLSSMRRGSSRV